MFGTHRPRKFLANQQVGTLGDDLFFIIMLSKGNIIYILHYLPYIHLDIYEVKRLLIMYSLPNEYYVELSPIIGKLRMLWIEKTLNLNKLIKCKYSRHFISTNEELILRKLEILLKYEQKPQ